MLVILLVGGSSAIASAQDTAADDSDQSTPASVSFADDRPLSVDVAQVRDHDGLHLLLHNDAARTQTITVRVIGLTDSSDPVAREFLSDESVSKPVPAGTSAVFDVPLGDAGEETPAAGSYPALIVANGETGGVTRRPLALSLAAPQEAAARKSALSPTDASDVTLVAVNYLPSPLGAVNYLLFGLGAICGLLLWVAWSRIEPKRRRLLGAAGALAIVAGLSSTIKDRDLDAGASLHLIAVQPVDVTADSARGTVGVVASSDGRLARLEVDESLKLRPQGLTTAASYSGPYDLAPSKEDVGEATATVNVRDWWPFAFATIALGVYGGYRLRRWFAQVRPRGRLRKRLQQMLAMFAARIGELRQRGGFEPGLEDWIDVRFDEVEDLIERDKLEEANKKLDELIPLFSGLIRLRAATYDLQQAIAQIAAQAQEEDLPISEIDALNAAKELLAGAGEGDEIAEGSEELDAQVKALKGATSLLTEISRRHAAIALHRRRAEQALHEQPPDPAQREALATLDRTFTDLGWRVLQAESLSEVQEIETLDDTALRQLIILLQPSRREGHALADRLTLPADSAIFDSYFAQHNPRELIFSNMIDAKPREPEVGLEYRILAVDPEETELYRGDLVQFKITISSTVGIGFTELEVDYGDAGVAHFHLPRSREQVELRDYRWIGDADPLVAVVRALPSGTEVARRELHVNRQPRLVSTAAGLVEADKLTSRLAFVLAVGSGLLSLYFSNASWGQPQDYLAAVLWGTVTAEGVKLAASIADRAWPGGG